MAPVAVSIVRLFLRSALGAQPFADPGDGLKPIIDPTIDNGARLPELGDFSSTIGNNLGGGVSIDPSIKPLCIISSAFEADQKTRERFSAIFLLFALCMLLTCMPVVMKAFGDHISKENSEKGQKFVDRFTVKMRLLVYFSQQVATGVAFATALIHVSLRIHLIAVIYANSTLVDAQCRCLFDRSLLAGFVYQDLQALRFPSYTSNHDCCLRT